MPSFFYNSVKEQIKLAIKNNDSKLVQILLGSEFCQLWQYWLAHAMISYNMLAIERATQCNLPLQIIERQKGMLQESLRLLTDRKQALENNEQGAQLQGEERNLTNMKDLMSRLFRDARQVAQDYKELIEQENVPGINYLYCTPNESITSGNNSTDVAVRARDEVGISGYTAQSLRNVSAVTQLNFVQGCNALVDEMEKMVIGEVWNQTNLSTKVGYYLDEVSNYITGENGQLLDEAINYIPNNTYSSLLRRCLAVFRPVVSGLQMANDYVSNDLQRISCVNSRIEEISSIRSDLDNMAEEKSRLKEQLREARQEVKEKAVDKMTDGKLLDKEFVHTMYEKLLDYYLMKASIDKENLLHDDIKNNGIDVVRRRILDQAKHVDVDMTAELLNYAISKNREANVEVISVLIINLAHTNRLFNIIEGCGNTRVKELCEKSNNTIMIDVHDSLFDFDDKLVNLVSVFPSKEGNFDRRSSEDKVMLEQIGGEKYQKIVMGIKALKEELDKKRQIWENKENRDTWLIFKPFYMIYDQIYKGLSEEQCLTVHGQAVELHRRALYTDQFKDEGIMYDYVRKAKAEEGYIATDKEVKKDIERLYGTANQGWEKAKGVYKLGSFLEDTCKMADELKNRKMAQKDGEKREAQEGERKAIQMAGQEAQARQSAEQKAEQEAQRAEQEAQARQSAEQRARQLEQALEQKNLEGIAIRACNRKLGKLDDELQDAVNKESEDKIVEAAMSYTRGSPEQVIDAIIEEIKVNREQIIKEGRVSAEIIESGIRSLLNQGTSLSDVNVSHGASAGVRR